MEDIMADTIKKADNATKGKRVTVRLPRLQGQNAIQEEFFSVNGKNFIIKRGETVEIPEEVAEVIRNAELAEEYAMKYVDGLAKAQKDKAEADGIKN
jgi:hypothetical protein